MTRSFREIHYPALILLLLMIVAGCAQPRIPMAEIDEAARAVAAARAADAGDHAPMELRFAEERLAAARTAADDRDGARAGMLAEQALVNAELAVAKARAARIRAEVQARSEQNAQLRRRLLGEGGQRP
jgi:hypothetical protein